MSLTALAVSASLASLALADVYPTAPGPNQSFIAGSNCTLEWDADTSGKWKNMSIDLMSGSNDNMSTVTNVASALDGTDTSLSPYNWTCPEVDPYSAIYFYQFTNGGNESDSQWTTRFTIASSSNTSVSPEHSQQPNGDQIPWGDGALASSNTTTTASISANVTSGTQWSASTVGTTASQSDQSAIPAVKNVAQASDGNSQRDATGGQDEDGGDDGDDDDDDDDDDGDDDDDDSGDDDDGDDARDTDSSNHKSSKDNGNSEGDEGSADDSGRDGSDSDGPGDSSDSNDSDGSGDSGNSADDPDDGNSRTFTSTKTFHHMHATQTPDPQSKDASGSNSDDDRSDDQDSTTDSFMTSSRMVKQHSSKATDSMSTRSDHPRATDTGSPDPTLSMPTEAARDANTDSAHASASASASGAETTTADGLGDSKLANAGALGISVAVGPAWLYLMLVAVGIAPQL